ncbi:MAG: protein kinase [Planctomycetes bacterium]|nr:protein kinase [Planctomycetota bacterium]
MPPPPAPPRLRRFELLEELGSGATGTTWRARARVAVGGLAPGAEVAVKILHPQLSALAAARDAFLREARAGMAVRHPNLVRSYAVEEVARPEGRLLYLVLEFLPGRTVRDWLDRDGVAGEPTLRCLARQVAGALAALHQHGLLHLDLKPENLLWDQDRAVLMDLGFARDLDTARDSGFLGTPLYAAPELLRGQPPSPATDLFALGVCLFEAATGERPFGDERAHGLFEARRTALVRRPSTIQPRLSPFLDELILRLLEESPQDRFSSASELESILDLGEQSEWWREMAKPMPLLPLVHGQAMPFVNRERELDLLEQAFAAARAASRPRLVVLEGAEALGKSRLAIELGQRWRTLPEAPPFLYGRCRRRSRPGTGSSLQPMRDALARSLGLAPGQPPGPAVSRRLHGALDGDSATTLLEILRGRPYPREKRRRAFSAWLAALGEEGPFLMFLDDVHLAGAALWEFLGDLTDQQRAPALLLVAHRPGLEPRAETERQRLLGNRRASLLRLGPMDDDAVRRLLASVFEPGALDSELEEQLMAGCAGAPGVLEALLRLLVQRGDLEGPPRSLRPVGLVAVPATASQELLLLTELAEMRGEQRELLQWAALFRPPLRIRLLAEAADIPEGRAARTLAELRRAGWLKIEGGHFRFTLPRDRAAAYRSMSEEEACRRHARAFEVIQATGLLVPSRESQLAFHAHRAGLHQEALELGLPRAEHALRQGALQRAARALDLLAGHRDALPQPPGAPIECRLLVAQARVAGLDGNHSREAELLKRAGGLAAADGDPLLRARVHLGLAHHAHAMGFEGAARIHAERARELWNPAPLAGP